MVAIIDKHKASVFNILLKILFFLGGEFYQLVATEVTEGATKNIIAAERNDVFVGIDFERGVFDERIEHIHRHALVYIPIARLVLKPGEEKTVVCEAHVINSNSIITKVDFSVQLIIRNCYERILFRVNKNQKVSENEFGDF